MANRISSKEREYASKISKLRNDKHFKEAVDVCNEAISLYGNNNFFYKLKGDILFIMKEYSLSMDAYMEYLDKIIDEPFYFTNFSRFVEKICNKYKLD